MSLALATMTTDASTDASTTPLMALVRRYPLTTRTQRNRVYKRISRLRAKASPDARLEALATEDLHTRIVVVFAYNRALRAALGDEAWHAAVALVRGVRLLAILETLEQLAD